MPDYAELTLPNLQFPLICEHVRHSLTHGLLADTVVGSDPVSTGASENAYLTAICARCPGNSSVTGVSESTATAANYADRVAAELTMSVPSERLARHSPALGINLQDEWCRSAGLPDQCSRTDR
jgi:hypothetical protein